MIQSFKLRKSAGVRVSGKVHRLLTDANRTRDARAWRDAIVLYRQALDADPSLGHIWIQLGHALKEAGELDQAASAYERAGDISPASADPWLHRGHLAKRGADPAKAARFYLAAARRDLKDPDAIAELHLLLAKGVDVPMETLRSLITDELEQPLSSDPPARVSEAARTADIAIRSLMEALRADAGETTIMAERALAATDFISELSRSWTDTPQAAEDRPVLIFDVSDLLTYFQNVRSPTGIQRVQIETIVSAMHSGTTMVQVCCFIEQRDEWVEIPASMFLNLCRLSLNDDEGEWATALTKALVLLGIAEPISFPQGAFLINLGTSWWLQNYFLMIRRVKALYGVRYVPFVHDMIPVLRGEFCPKALTQDFISWAIGVFEHADFFFVNSESTKRDLIRVGAYLGHAIDTETVSVVRLDTDYRKPAGRSKKPKLIRKWGLEDASFVLLVSTIEPRKNHLRAFEAWIALLRRHGPKRIPKLVCVGHPGWLNDAIHEQLNAHETLRAHVVMLSCISDDELTQLYEKCLFTLYPSHYEGWGLPVTESLCAGKVPLVSNVSSLPEAGGAFAVYFDPDSTHQLADALDKLIFDIDFRRERERDIAAHFVPRSWFSIADQMARDVMTWEHAQPKAWPVAPPATMAAYHPFGRNLSTHIWPGMRSAEIYRAGTNWWGPDNWGCWSKPGGARLEIGLPDSAGSLKLFLRLQSPPSNPCHFRIDIDSVPGVAEGDLRPEEFKWVSLDIPARTEGRTYIQVGISSRHHEDLRGRTNNSDQRVISIGVAGFFICKADDTVARAAFLEAAALGNVDDLSFSREPLSYNPLG